MKEIIEEARLDADSAGGIVEIGILGLPAGIGSPIFDTVEGRMAYGFYGIPAVKGVEFGAGFAAQPCGAVKTTMNFILPETEA